MLFLRYCDVNVDPGALLGKRGNAQTTPPPKESFGPDPPLFPQRARDAKSAQGRELLVYDGMDLSKNNISLQN